MACTEVEQSLIKSYSTNARQGYKLAKAVRLTSLISAACVNKLTAIVTDIHDCLKTYMLKTCLIVLHLREPSLKQRGNELLPEQWALLIYEQLLEFAQKGELPILLDCTLGDDDASVFRCEHELPFIRAKEHLRAACCDNRLNVMALAEHLFDVLREYCVTKGIDVDHVELPTYHHYEHLLWGDSAWHCNSSFFLSASNL